MLLDDEVCPSRRAVANLKSTIKMATGVELVAAAGRGERREVASLLRRGASVEDRDESGRTALMAAAEEGHADTVNALAGTYSANVEAADEKGWTALMAAALEGHTATVNALAGTHNADVEAVDEEGWTALMFAAQYGHMDIVNALRQYGASEH